MKKDNEFIDVRINYEEGDSNCEHQWEESRLLQVKVCQKCKRIEPLNK